MGLDLFFFKWLIKYHSQVEKKVNLTMPQPKKRLLLTR